MQPLSCSYCSMNFTLCLWEIQQKLTWEEPCSSHAWLPTLQFAGIPLSHVPRADRWLTGCKREAWSRYWILQFFKDAGLAHSPSPTDCEQCVSWEFLQHCSWLQEMNNRAWGWQSKVWYCSLSLACKRCAATDRWSLWTAEAAQS